jgi:hypothetical protein
MKDITPSKEPQIPRREFFTKLFQWAVGLVVFFKKNFSLAGITNFTLSGTSSGFVNGTNLNFANVSDPYSGNVVLLLYADSFTDQKGKSITNSGTVSLNSSVKKYGTSSFYFAGNNYVYATSTSTDFNYGAGNFTIEFMVYPLSGPVSSYNPTFFTNHGDGDWNSSGTGIRIHHQYTIFGGSFPWITHSPAIQNNVWTHYALVRNGNTLTVFINGQAAGNCTASGNLGADADRIALATSDGVTSGGREFLNGYIDNVRITKGIARYTASFTIGG